MSLVGEEFSQFETALISAFPSRFRLTQMIRHKFDLSLETIAEGQNYAEVVFNLLRWAESQGKVDELLKKAREANPSNNALIAFEQQMLLKGRPDSRKPAVSRGSVTPSTYIESKLRFEFIYDPYVWFRQLHKATQAVCRIEAFQSLGTGFLVAPDLVLTCYHNLEAFKSEPSDSENFYPKRFSSGELAGVKFRFGYWIETRDASGVKFSRQGHTYQLASDWLVDSSPINDLNYALLRIDGSPGSDTITGLYGEEQRGWLPLEPKVSFKAGEPMFVLHHASGQPLKLSNGLQSSPPLNSEAWENLEVKSKSTSVTYETSTEPGSSGAPCFTASWQLFAMHERRLSTADSLSPICAGIAISSILEQTSMRAALAQTK